MIDFGQAAKIEVNNNLFRSDERYLLAQFLRYFGEGNPEKIAEIGSKMAVNPEVITQAQKESLSRRLGEILENENLSMKNKLAETLNAFNLEEIPLKTVYSFESLKSLMMIFGEKYVDDKAFMEILENHIKKAYISKIGVSVLNSCHQTINSFFKKFTP